VAPCLPPKNSTDRGVVHAILPDQIGDAAGGAADRQNLGGGQLGATVCCAGLDYRLPALGEGIRPIVAGRPCEQVGRIAAMPDIATMENPERTWSVSPADSGQGGLMWPTLRRSAG
jgi:hypothetical protein